MHASECEFPLCTGQGISSSLTVCQEALTMHTSECEFPLCTGQGIPSYLTFICKAAVFAIFMYLA